MRAIHPCGRIRVPTHSLIFTRARLISAAMIAASPLITALMSVLFYGEVRGAMLVTNLVCAVVIDRVVQRITRHYRGRLRAAHETLEQRVEERTRDLERANQTLRTAAMEQAALRAELIGRDRLATAGMVAAGVSHEIRSPLTVIRFALDDVAGHRDRLPADLQEMIADAGDAASRIEVILRDLTSLARPADEPVVATDLAATLDATVRLARYRLGKGVRLERAEIDVPPVRANASRLVQVFLNLIMNAARATRPDALNHIRIAARVEGARVVVAVSDTGCGMSEATRAQLFQPFFTTGRDSGGTGLGLVICRTMIDGMGGSLAITSALGAGTTVEISLQGCTAEVAAPTRRTA
jgi:two-component system NtrC family sensor kinase